MFSMQSGSLNPLIAMFHLLSAFCPFPTMFSEGFCLRFDETLDPDELSTVKLLY